MKICSGYPKVHFGTIVEGSFAGAGGGGGGGRCTVGPPGSLTISDYCLAFKPYLFSTLNSLSNPSVYLSTGLSTCPPAHLCPLHYLNCSSDTKPQMIVSESITRSVS